MMRVVANNILDGDDDDTNDEDDDIYIMMKCISACDEKVTSSPVDGEVAFRPS